MHYACVLLLVASCGRITIEDDATPIHGDPDASVSPNATACSACNSEELCVEFFDGTCGFAGVKCVAKTMPACEPSVAACSTECDQAYCKPANEIFQCAYRNGCNPDPRAFTCYGP